MGTKKTFQISLDKDKIKARIVAPFSQQSMQPNTVVYPPPRLHVFRERNIGQTLFQKYFDRGDIPIARAYNKKCSASTVIVWRKPPKDLDYSHYLPIFFDGLGESKLPYKLLARSGVTDLLNAGGNKILPVIPQLIIPIKNALNTRNPDIIAATLKAIQHLLKTGPFIGKALVPYYRQILPIFNLMRNVNLNIGDKIDYNSNGTVGDNIERTLQLLEKTGGQDAFINIKYMVPTYESCVMN